MGKAVHLFDGLSDSVTEESSPTTIKYQMYQTISLFLFCPEQQQPNTFFQ